MSELIKTTKSVVTSKPAMFVYGAAALPVARWAWRGAWGLYFRAQERLGERRASS